MYKREKNYIVRIYINKLDLFCHPKTSKTNHYNLSLIHNYYKFVNKKKSKNYMRTLKKKSMTMI